MGMESFKKEGQESGDKNRKYPEGLEKGADNFVRGALEEAKGKETEEIGRSAGRVERLGGNPEALDEANKKFTTGVVGARRKFLDRVMGAFSPSENGEKRKELREIKGQDFLKIQEEEVRKGYIRKMRASEGFPNRNEVKFMDVNDVARLMRGGVATDLDVGDKETLVRRLLETERHAQESKEEIPPEVASTLEWLRNEKSGRQFFSIETLEGGESRE